MCLTRRIKRTRGAHAAYFAAQSRALAAKVAGQRRARERRAPPAAGNGAGLGFQVIQKLFPHAAAQKKLYPPVQCEVFIRDKGDVILQKLCLPAPHQRRKRQPKRPHRAGGRHGHRAFCGVRTGQHIAKHTAGPHARGEKLRAVYRQLHGLYLAVQHHADAAVFIPGMQQHLALFILPACAGHLPQQGLNFFSAHACKQRTAHDAIFHWRFPLLQPVPHMARCTAVNKFLSKLPWQLFFFLYYSILKLFRQGAPFGAQKRGVS